MSTTLQPYLIPPPSYLPSPQDIEQDLESSPLDLQCYCQSCEMQRSLKLTITRNLKYGYYFPFLLFWNLLIGLRFYWREKRMEERLKFSESILWDEQRLKKQVNLVNMGTLAQVLESDELYRVEETNENLVYGLLYYHYTTRRKFYKIIGWSAIGLVTWGLIIGLILILAFSGGTLNDLE